MYVSKSLHEVKSNYLPGYLHPWLPWCTHTTNNISVVPIKRSTEADSHIKFTVQALLNKNYLSLSILLARGAKY